MVLLGRIAGPTCPAGRVRTGAPAFARRPHLVPDGHIVAERGGWLRRETYTASSAGT